MFALRAFRSIRLTARSDTAAAPYAVLRCPHEYSYTRPCPGIQVCKHTTMPVEPTPPIILKLHPPPSGLAYIDIPAPLPSTILALAHRSPISKHSLRSPAASMFGPRTSSGPRICSAALSATYGFSVSFFQSRQSIGVGAAGVEGEGEEEVEVPRAGACAEKGGIASGRRTSTSKDGSSTCGVHVRVEHTVIV